MTRFDDAALRSALEPARQVEPTDAEILGAVRKAQSAHRPQPWRTLAVVAILMALLGGSAYSVPATRAAIEDITSAFAGLVVDQSEAPGRALRPDEDAPAWVTDRGGRLIAETDGVRLYVTRTDLGDGDTQLDFVLGNDGAIVSDSIDGWRKRFKDHAVVVLGPLPVDAKSGETEGGRIALLGVTARSVDWVALRYGTGAPTVRTGVDGGFVLIADPRRPLQDIVAYDSSGQELDRTDVSDIGAKP